MKKFFKQTLIFFMVLTLFVPSLTNVINAKPKQSTVKKAYTSYIKKNIKKDLEYTNDLNYYFHDFNKDGIPEMIVASLGGARGAFYVYTYYNGKVIMAHKKGTFFNDIFYIKNKKYLVGYWGGASYAGFTLYKIKKGKLHEVATYANENPGVYTKNDKKISEKQYNKAFNKLIWPKEKIHSIN